MARKTFISYKHDEAINLRDRIIDAMGDDASYYMGETSESPNLSDKKTETIRKNLSDMMYKTSVTIVIISPNMKQSNWIEWEISYCLKRNTRSERTSNRNGVVGVIMKSNGSYDWARTKHVLDDGFKYYTYSTNLFLDIINENRFNQDPLKYSNEKYKTVSSLTGHYITLVDEEEFLNNIDKYIENAFSKSENDASGYKLSIEQE